MPTGAKILQIFYHKKYSIDASEMGDLKKRVALPPFILRSPHEVPLAIALIKEKSEEFQHNFNISNILPKQYPNARLAISILDQEVVKHIGSCFTKGKLREMEDMTKPLTNRHQSRLNFKMKHLRNILLRRKGFRHLSAQNHLSG